MELFVLLSFVGTFILLSTHVLDYVAESLQRPMGVGRASMPDNDEPTGEESAPLSIAEHYDRAA